MSDFTRDTSLDVLKKRRVKVLSQFSDIDNQWTAGVFVDGKKEPVCTAVAEFQFKAEELAAAKYRKEQDKLSVIEEKVLGTNALASDLCEQEKVMAGLIEKAKRSGIDGRLIAMANTDFERGFMALEKAINTNKG